MAKAKRSWQLQEAKNRFSDLVNEALRQGPQTVTRRGVETVVVLSVEDYQKLSRPASTLVDFFRGSPLFDEELDLDRRSDLSRKVDL